MSRDSFPIVGLIIAAVIIVLITALIPARVKIEQEDREKEMRENMIRGNLSVMCIDGYEYLYHQAVIGGSLNIALVPRFDPLTDKPKHCLSSLDEEEEEEEGDR